jgi:hypothetical protein
MIGLACLLAKNYLRFVGKRSQCWAFTLELSVSSGGEDEGVLLHPVLVLSRLETSTTDSGGYFFCIFAHESLRVTVRLKMGVSGVASWSRQK